MEEVKRGLVFYQVLPAGTGSRTAGDGA
jgi:hypothetical protein